MTCKIYKLQGYGLTYYGSTKSPLGTRKSQHKNHYKLHQTGKQKYLTSFDIIEKGNDWDIELVEEVEDIANLLTREGFYIKNNECVNKRIAGKELSKNIMKTMKKKQKPTRHNGQKIIEKGLSKSIMIIKQILMKSEGFIFQALK